MRRAICGLSCGLVARRLHPFVDGELPRYASHRIDEHLEECNPCRDRVAVTKDMSRLVRRCVCADDAPTGLRTRILSQCPGPERLVGEGVPGDHLRPHTVQARRDEAPSGTDLETGF